MQADETRRWVLACGALAVLAGAARGQDLEPRRWSHLPVGMNVIGAGYTYSEGDLFLDPVLEIEDAKVESHSAYLSYVRSFELAGKSARVDVLLPYAQGEWSGLLQGAPASTEREGLADPRLRLSINLVGAPPLAGAEYAKFRRDNPVYTTVGAAVAVTLPLGEYDADRLINLGANRFTIRPQIGVLHTRGPWSYEMTGSIFFYTDNTDFFGDSKLERDPVFALQAHAVRTFGRGWWVAAGGGYGLGGETEIDGRNNDNHIGNFLLGASVGAPLTANQGVSLKYIRWRTNEAVGSDTDTLVLGWSLRF